MNPSLRPNSCTGLRSCASFLMQHSARFTKKVFVLGVACSILASVGRVNASITPPTDNTSAPFMGIYGGGIGNDSNYSGIDHGDYTTGWLYRSGLWQHDGESFTNWADIEGPGWALDPWLKWRAINPNGTIEFTLPLLPGSGHTPLAGTSLAQGATGAYNAHFATLADNLNARGLTTNIIIRLGHEFTGNWYPWCPTNGADAQNYAKYWHQVVTTMKARPGCSGLKFDWCGACAANDGNYSMDVAYPGTYYPDTDVDYIGCDIYDASWAANAYGYASVSGTWVWSQSAPTVVYPPTFTAAQILAAQQIAWSNMSGTGNNGLTAWKNFAAAHGKPMSIPEWGCISRSDFRGGADNTNFIQQMYNFIYNPANNVGYHSYFDYGTTFGGSQLVSLPGRPATQFPNAAALWRKLFAMKPFFMDSDIGTVGLAGITDPVSIHGAGTGFLAGGTSDSFHFSALPTTGDDVYSAKISSMTTGATRQGGIMLRSGTGVSDPYVALYVCNGQCIFQSRTTSGAAAVQNLALSGTVPMWLKLTRQGNLVRGYQSTDGLNWTGSVAESQTVTMTGTNYFGLAVCSGTTTAFNAVGIDKVDYLNIDNVLGVTGSITSAIVLDNAAASGVTITGSWVTATSPSGFYGTNYLHDNNANKGACSVKFSPTIPTTQQYDVYACWSLGVGGTIGGYLQGNNVPISITSVSGTTQLRVNQAVGSQIWNYLGTYTFAAGTTGNVVISNSSTDNGYVKADAIMCVPVPGTATTLPPPHLDVDIGSPTLTGSATYSGGVYTVVGAGTDINNPSDQFHYVYQSTTATGTLVARVTGLTYTSYNAKGGLMFRQTLTGTSPFAMVHCSPTGWVELTTRSQAGAMSIVATFNSGITPSSTTPVWLKLTNANGNFAAYYSTSVGTPTTWTSLGTTWVGGFTGSAYGGLAVTSNLATARATGTFDNVSP